MKSSLYELFRSAFGPKDEKFRQRISIFLVCLVISIIIWFSVKLANNFATVIELPVTFSNIPKNKVLTGLSDSVLYVEVVEKGSDLFRLQYIQKISSATISLKNISLYHSNGTYTGIVNPSIFINDIEHEHGLMGKIISIKPDTIFLTFENLKSKKLPVKVVMDVTYEKEFMPYGPVLLEPDSVQVKGPVKLMEGLDGAFLGILHDKNLKSTTTLTLPFTKDSVNRLLEFTPGEIKVTIPVERYTESEITSNIKVIDNRDEKVKIFPDRAKVYFKIALKDYPKIEPGMISIAADFSDVNYTEDDKVRLQVLNHPDYIQINKIEPEKVEFIIIK